jgi:hypothetical protein
VDDFEGSLYILESWAFSIYKLNFSINLSKMTILFIEINNSEALIYKVPNLILKAYFSFSLS